MLVCRTGRIGNDTEWRYGNGDPQRLACSHSPAITQHPAAPPLNRISNPRGRCVAPLGSFFWVCPSRSRSGRLRGVKTKTQGCIRHVTGESRRMKARAVCLRDHKLGDSVRAMCWQWHRREQGDPGYPIAHPKPQLDRSIYDWKSAAPGVGIDDEALVALAGAADQAFAPERADF